MNNPILHERPMMRQDPPLTANSIRLAKQAQLAERAKATAESGIQFNGDTPILPRNELRLISRAQQLACNEAVDLAVETYGLDAVIRSLRLVAAANGRTL